MNILLIFLLCLIPAEIWLTIFWLKYRDKEPQKWLLYAFFSGMVALLPVLGFSYLWKIFTGVEWVDWVGGFTKYTTLLAVLSIFWMAVLEEFFKHRAVLGIGSEVQMKFDSISDGMLYSVTAAIGFSFLENTAYLWTLFASTGLNSEFWSVFLFRSLGTMLGHIVFSGVFGFFWGVAIMAIMNKHAAFHHEEDSHRSLRRFYVKFFVSHTKDHPLKQFWQTLTLHTIRSFALHEEKLNYKLSPHSLVAEGFWLAALLHMLFNILVSFQWQGQSLIFISVPFLSLGLLFLLHQESRFKHISLRATIPKHPVA